MACVITTTKDFKALVNQYNASIGTMELAIKSYMNENSTEEYDVNDNAFKTYLKNYFKLGETNIYESESELNTALKIWDGLNSKFDSEFSKGKATQFAESMIEVFGEENVILFQNNNGKYQVRVAKPILKDEKTTSSQESDINNPSIKPGVSEVFESNPELANTVYEALGFGKDSNYYEGNIKPEPNTIFVFGSNPEGRHGAGAAKVAREQFGAVYGQGEGLQGNAYALPTKDLRVKENKGFKSISPEQITNSIKKLYEIAKQNPNKQFKVAYRNTTDTSLNGYTGLEMIEMFNQAGTIPSNVIFSKEWVDTNKLSIQSEITPQQKQQAIQVYSNYLNTIFPYSKVKDIVVHGSKNKEEVLKNGFSKEKVRKDEESGKSLFEFTTSKIYAQQQGSIIAVLLNVTSDNIQEQAILSNGSKAIVYNDYFTVDNTISSGDMQFGISKKEMIERGIYYTVFKPEQIHILGSKQDIKEFKKFIKTNSSKDLKFTNIYAGTNENSELSNLAIRPFRVDRNLMPERLAQVEVDREFKSVEQAFQYYKAVATQIVVVSNPEKDLLTQKEYDKIRSLKHEIFNASPSEAKALGKTIKMPKLAIEYWDSISSDVMKSLIKQSFEQNKNAKQLLLATDDSILTHLQDKSKWGTEFPKLLMEVREEFQNPNTNNKFIESQKLVDRIINDSKSNIKFDEKTHTYTVHGKKADFSVTQYIRGNEELDLGAWGLPSSVLGSTVDMVTRDFFNGTLKSKYPNLNKEALTNLTEDLKDLKNYFDNDKFKNKKYKIVTTEFPIASTINITGKDGKSTQKLIAGTMDMLIFDEDGNFYIYDMKTSRSSMSESKIDNYTKQLSMYKSILEANYPELKGKIKELKILHFSLHYPSPYGINNVIENEYTQDDNSIQLYLNGKPIQQSEDYSAPRLETSIIGLTPKIFQEQLGALTSSEKELLSEEMTFNKETKDVYQQTLEEQQRDILLNPVRLPAQEREFLAKSVMTMTSIIISHLQTVRGANEKYFDKKFNFYDFTRLSREEIIDIVGINTIFDVIKETFFNTSNISHITDDAILDKLDLIYENWGALLEMGKDNLINLEGISLNKVTSVEKVHIETGSEEIEQGLENLEEQPREYWQIGQRQISAKSSLSIGIRRTFERLPVLDANGQEVLDPYGYNIPQYVDSNLAVNSILDWCKECSTIEEMESKLKEMAKDNYWVNSVLSAIKVEPFRSQFYQNFRKDFTNYSIITVEEDDKGNKIYKTQIINTKGVVKTMLDEIKSAFQEGVMGNLIIVKKNNFEGKGKVNLKSVNQLKLSLISNILTPLEKADKQNQKALSKKITELIPEITQIMRELGIHVNESMITATLRQDLSKRNLSQTKVIHLVRQMTRILDTLIENSNNPDYNPLSKSSISGNVYNNYKNIITEIGKHVQDNIESSTFENGKMYYSFTIPSYLQGVITNLSDAIKNKEKFDDYIEENYGSYKWFKNNDGSWNNTWLELLTKSSEMRNNLEHKVQLSFEAQKGKKIQYNELGELGYTLSLMHEFFFDKNKKWAWYRVPILSDKESSEFIKFKRYSENFERDITREMKKTFNQEIMRIKTVLERATTILDGDIDISEIKNFDAANILKKEDNATLRTKLATKKKITHSDLVRNGKLVLSGSGAEFKFLEMFNNNIIANDELGKLIIDKLNGEEINEVKFNNMFESQFKDYMNDIFVREKSVWKSAGLYTKKPLDDKKDEEIYIYASQFGKTEEEIDASLKEYLWNDMLATTNIVQLTVTDLAYYKNVEDFQKRYAQVHSPTMKLNISAEDANGVRYSRDGRERTVYLTDVELISDIVPQIKNIFYNRVKLGQMTQFEADAILAKYGYSNYTSNGKDYVKSKIDDKDILIPSERINVADAQAYSSPTSYRKKMGMSGRWTEEMEEAYNIIRSGDWNGDDLKVVWQPMKPFVYSQIRKTSGVDTMSELKVPVQNKNSEYLLIMADAILRGDKRNSKLTAIYDFMEESAYDNGVYNGIGIDTVQFSSAVKSGLMGEINLNGDLTSSEIKQILKNAVYEADGSYNHQVVHEIPFEDYGIQQEVPAHLVDSKQLMGSQMRILSISDIGVGATFKVHGEKETWNRDKLTKTYQELIAENINESFDKLIKSFNLKGSRVKMNKAISAILIDAIKKDQKYGVDLLNACSLDPATGEFKIPLSDPIQSTRIQQLLNSIIKSRINKQTISGGPVVQASVFGMSDDLEIIWKGKRGEKLMNRVQWEAVSKKKQSSYEEYLEFNNATLNYFEVYMPIPSEALERALTKPDGSLMSIEEALENKLINPEQLKAIGYRIPTEDKYSMVPIKVKGFLPKSAGEVIMLPKEITLLSGSDFDIDKMYIMLKEFDVIEYDMAKAKKRFASDFSKEGLAIGNTTFDEWFEGVKQHFRLRETKFIEKTLADENTNASRNNKIFDIQWAVLTNQDTMHKMFNPGSFDTQKKTAKIITILKNPNNKLKYSQLEKLTLNNLNDLVEQSSNKNILFSSTQVYLHKQNMTAAKLIGIFANHNTSHAFISMQDIRLKIDKDTEFNFNGKRMSVYSNPKLDNIMSLDGKTPISKVIAGFLAASVDAVKEPVLNFLNLNTFTANPAMLLARLGFDSDSIGLLLTQPVIEDITKDFFKKNNEEYVSVEQVIDDKLLEFKTKHGINVESKDLKSNDFLKEDLAENISNFYNGKISKNYLAYQAQVLMLFKKLAIIGKDLNTLTYLTKFNSVTNAVGPTIADTLVMQMKYETFMSEMNDNKLPFTSEAMDVINNSPILEAFYHSTVSPRGASYMLFSKYFPHYSENFSDVLNNFKRGLKGNLDSKLINTLLNDYMVYRLTMPVIDRDGNKIMEPVFDTRKNREYYMKDFYVEDGVQKKGFTTKFKEEVKNIIDNELINAILVKAKDPKLKVTTLEVKTGGYSIDLQERIKNAWTSLLVNPETRELGVDLFFYNMTRSGFAFSPKTFMHLSSVYVKQMIPGYIEGIEMIQKEYSNNSSPGEFLQQFRRNHADNRKIVPKFVPSDNVKLTIDKSVSNKKIYTFVSKDKNFANSIIVSKEPASMIVYKKKLLSFIEFDEGRIVYEETSPLGSPFNFLEYDGTADALEMVSALTTPTDVDIDTDYFNPNDELSNEELENILLEKVLTQREKNILGDYQQSNASESKMKDVVKTMLEERLTPDVSERIQEQIEKLIKKLC